MQKVQGARTSSAGFSIIELIIAMAVTLVIMAMASGLLAKSLGVRTRENTRVEAVADVQRALNLMTREIANAGLGMSTNGIVAADSNAQQIRIRSNLNGFGGVGTPGLNDTSNQDQDVLFSIINNGASRMIYRFDVNTGQPASLADRVDTLQIAYLNAANAAVAPAAAAKVRLTIGVTLPAVGAPNSPGYQPPSRMQVSADVTLRNSDLRKY